MTQLELKLANSNSDRTT